MNKEKCKQIDEKRDDLYLKKLAGITKKAGITAFGSFFLLILSFITNAVITRSLGADQYGLYVLSTRVLEIFMMIASFGFGLTIVRTVSFQHAVGNHSRIKGTINYSFKALLVTSVFLVVAGFMFNKMISVRLFHRPELSPLLGILLLSVPITTMTLVAVSALNGLKKIRESVLVTNVINPLQFLILAVFVLQMDYGLKGLVWVFTFTGITGLFFAWFFLNKIYLSRYKTEKAYHASGELWRFSTPLFFNQLLNNAVRWIPVFVMGFYLSNSEIGIFNVALKISLLVSFALGAFQLIFAPVMAEQFALKNSTIINQLNKTITKWIFSSALMVFSILFLYSNTFLEIFGTEFKAGKIILIILMTGELINAGVGLAGNLLIMSGRPQLAFVNSLVSFFLVSLLSFMLIPVYGAKGAAFAIAAAVLLVNLLRICEIWYLEKIHPFRSSFVKPVVAAALSAVIVLSLNHSFSSVTVYGAAGGMVLFTVIFILVIWILRPDDEDRFILKQLKRYFKK